MRSEELAAVVAFSILEREKPVVYSQNSLPVCIEALLKSFEMFPGVNKGHGCNNRLTCHNVTLLQRALLLLIWPRNTE